MAVESSESSIIPEILTLIVFFAKKFFRDRGEKRIDDDERIRMRGGFFESCFLP